MGCICGKQKKHVEQQYQVHPEENLYQNNHEVQSNIPISKLQMSVAQKKNKLYIIDQKVLVQENCSGQFDREIEVKQYKDQLNDVDQSQQNNSDKENKISIFQKNLISRTQNEIEEKEEREAQRKKLEQQQIEIENLKAQLKNEQSQAKYQIQQYEINLEAFRAKIMEVENKNQQQENEIKLQKSQIKNYETQNKIQLFQLEEQKKELEQNEEDIIKLKDELFLLKVENTQSQAQLNDNQAQLKVYEVQLKDYESKINKYHKSLEKLCDVKSKINFAFQNLLKQHSIQNDLPYIKEKEEIDEILLQFEIEFEGIVAIQPLPQHQKLDQHKIMIKFNGFQEDRQPQNFWHDCQSEKAVWLNDKCQILCEDDSHNFNIEEAVFIFNLNQKHKVIQNQKKGNKTEGNGIAIRSFSDFEKFLYQCLQGKQLKYSQFSKTATSNYKSRNMDRQFF